MPYTFQCTFAYVSSFMLSLLYEVSDYLHFTDDKTEVQWGEGTYLTYRAGEG